MQSKLILGTVQFGLNYGINNSSGKITPNEANEILHFANQNKISILDTASAYGNSEKVIGDFLCQNNQIQFDIITKLKHTDNVDFEELLENSLTKLKQPKVKYLMFHSFDDYQEFKDDVNILTLKGIKYDSLGVSVYTNDEIESVIEDKNIDLIQVPFNLLDNEFQRGNYLIKAKEFGKLVHVRSIFLQGLFFMDKENLPTKFKDLTKAIQEIKDIAESNNISIAELAMSYVLSKDYIDGVLFGVDSLEHLKNNLEISHGNLDGSIIAMIDAIKVEKIELLNPSKW